MIRTAGLLVVAVGLILGAGAGLSRAVRAVIESTAALDESQVPTTTVRRGDVTITVPAAGELQGGGSESLFVPMTGVAELPIIYLRENGEYVEAGEVVAEFDASEQEFNLAEALEDLEEAEQKLVQAEAQARATLEEARLELARAEADLEIAGLEMRKNEVLAEVQQRQNAIALERATIRVSRARDDLTHRETTLEASVAVERAAVNEARTKAETAERTMADLTIRAGSSGYVQLGENLNGLSYIFTGMQVPRFQTGDAARPGQMVAQIPDMSRWEISAQIPETDRAYLEVGQEVAVRPTAMPAQELRGRISLLGGASGNAWSRTFNCRIALEDTLPALRPGMTADIVITVETLDDVLWLPSQALFESDGRRFVYRETPEGFIATDVDLVRRTESQAVIAGLDEGETIALARPGSSVGAGSGGGSALGALGQ